MKELLDVKGRKKVAIIEKIFKSKEHSCSQIVLLKELNMTYPTLRSLVETINMDAAHFGYDHFSIIHSHTNQMYTLNIHEENSIQLIIHSYVKESPKFQLLDLLLTTSFPNLKSAADRLFISYNSLRKDIYELNELLRQYDFSVSLNNGVSLVGDEVGIRLYYTFLFLALYGGETWPFKYIRYYEITELLDNCPSEIYKSGYLDKNVLVHYCLAIHLLRIRQNKYISDSHSFIVPLYKPYTPESKQSYEAFSVALKNHVPNINEKSLNLATSFILSTIIALGSYSFIDKAPSFFYLEKEFSKINFHDITSAICKKVDQHLSSPFSDIEREKLIYSIMSVNYRYLLFRNLNLNLESMIIGYGNIEGNSRKRHKTKHLKLLIQKFMDLDELAIFEPNKKELAADYFLILEKRIDFAKHTLPIKVAILSIISTDTSVSDFLSFFSDYYNVHVCEKMEGDVDLVISDISMSNQVLTVFSINQPIVYVNTRWSESDYEKINSKLAEIATSKFINRIEE